MTGFRRGLLLAAAVALLPGSGDMPPDMPPPDPGRALAAEFAAARAAGSSAALIGFIARHPDTPSAAEARVALAARRQPDPEAAPGAAAGPGRDPGTDPDAAIVAAFDRARLAGPTALAGFAAAYPNHPLGLEAQRRFWREP